MYRYGVALEGAVYWGNMFSFTLNNSSQFRRCLKLSVQLFNLTLSAFCLVFSDLGQLLEGNYIKINNKRRTFWQECVVLSCRVSLTYMTLGQCNPSVCLCIPPLTCGAFSTHKHMPQDVYTSFTQPATVDNQPSVTPPLAGQRQEIKASRAMVTPALPVLRRYCRV